MLLKTGFRFTVTLAAAIAAPAAIAQSFPTQNIRIVVGSGVSTPSDIISRVIATEISNAEKWTVVVENRAGASNTLGGVEVLKAPADGHTIFNAGLPIAAAPALQARMPFDLLKDFEPLVQLARNYNVLVVNPTFEGQSLPALVKVLQSKPDQLNFSSGGLGTPAHLVGELFKQQAKVRAAHVPYVQFPQAIGDLLNGTNHFMFITTLPVMGLIKEGKLNALAVTAPQRLSGLPEVKTVGELGYPGLTVGDWSGMMVKRGTPAQVVDRLNAAINAALKQPSVLTAFDRVAAEPVGGPPEVFGKQLREDVERWGKVIAEAGIKPN